MIMSLAEQLRIQHMYNTQIKDGKSERQLVEDELEKTRKKLKQVTSPTTILKKD